MYRTPPVSSSLYGLYLYGCVCVVIMRSLSDVALQIGTHGMSLIQSNYLVGSNCCIIYVSIGNNLHMVQMFQYLQTGCLTLLLFLIGVYLFHVLNLIYMIWP